MYFTKFIRFFYIALAGLIVVSLASCHAGVTEQSASGYGTLLSYNLARSYSTDDVVNQANLSICQSLESTSSECLTNLANLKSDFNFQVSQIKENNLNISNISAYNLEYISQGLTTDGHLNYVPTTMSGTIFMPQTKRLTDIKGIILYYHPAMYNANEFSSTSNIEDATAANFAGLYASQGYIVIMSDLPGYGADGSNMRPFIYPKVMALAGINMLKAANSMFKLIGFDNLPKQPIIINGFSGGGMIAQWASYLLQNNSSYLTDTNAYLSQTILMSGAYDLSGIQFEMESANVTSVNESSNTFKVNSGATAAVIKPGMVAFAEFSFINYNPRYKCEDILAHDFCNFTFGESQLNVSNVFMNKGFSTSVINQIFYAAAESVPAINPYSIVNNGIGTLTQSNVLPEFTQALKSADLTSWTTTTPLTYIYLARDSVLTPYNSINNYNNLKATSDPKLINAIEIQNDHYYTKLQNILGTIDHTNYMQYIATISVLRK